MRAEFSYVKHEPQTTGSFPAPYNDDRSYQGVWSYTNNRYETGTWCELGDGGGACGASPYSTYGALNYNTKTHFDLEGTPGNAAIFGTSVYYAGNHAPFTNFLGGAMVWIEDTDAPAVTEDAGLSDGSWASHRAFQARGTDTGLGLRKLVLDSPANPGWGGAYSYDAGCTGDRRSRCPQAGFVYSDTGRLPEGIQPVRYTATDAVGNVASRTWMLRIDRSAPAVLPEVGRPPLIDDAEATEFETTAEAADKGAGVHTIDFELVNEDGAVLDESRDPEPQSCDQRCSKTRTWSFQPQYLYDGTYTLRITATDQLGNAGTDERTIVIARGVPPIRR